jgi:hypothetical protein
MSENENRHISLESLVLQPRPNNEGMKYLGFTLKVNSYNKKDWQWLCAKVEKRLLSWYNRWLSRVGRLVLVKSVLEAIPVFWTSLAWVPKAFLRESSNFHTSFLWSGSKEKTSCIFLQSCIARFCNVFELLTDVLGFLCICLIILMMRCD